MTNSEISGAPLAESEPQQYFRPSILVQLMVASGSTVKQVATVNLVSSPRRGESVEFEDDSGAQKMFRIMEVVHREDGLRLYGQVNSNLTL